ncbi:uncharacterized protein PgNI_01432 [Pyricularia grisea]|uniref:Uncharacterized protein n=1 Tax=Pyricularia grisea TaxID=148305 RepID=A0A6P8BG63_PYRGI|nr:uncharacterized protein PgNI_01432 [Pyricularia grisea]TLD15695.1 hypothetical protein PgNI_01432 [Pyricularia grisea]
MVITAEESEFPHVPKIWIPERMDFKGEATISNFVENEACINECTLRFAPMRPSSTNLQMLIPTAMINDAKPVIKFYAQAYRANDANAPNQVLDYSTWTGFSNSPNVQRRSILERRVTCPATCRAKKAARASAKAPSSSGLKTSSPAVSKPPSSAAISRPPSSAGSRTPGSAVSKPPSSAAVSRPPSSAAVSRPPSSAAVSRPPSSAAASRPPSSAGVSRPPSSAGSRTPGSAGSKPIGSSQGTTRP